MWCVIHHAWNLTMRGAAERVQPYEHPELHDMLFEEAIWFVPGVKISLVTRNYRGNGAKDKWIHRTPLTWTGQTTVVVCFIRISQKWVNWSLTSEMLGDSGRDVLPVLNWMCKVISTNVAHPRILKERRLIYFRHWRSMATVHSPIYRHLVVLCGLAKGTKICEG